MAKDKGKDKKKDRGAAKPAKVKAAAGGHVASAADQAGGQHHAAAAHGRPTTVDESLPATRAELMTLHRAARARRNTAALDSPTFRAAVMDIERIEIRIAAIDRAADPPLG
jgi:hypothetical protein